MELKRIGIEQKEAIKKLFVSVFTIEPWNDDWSDEKQLDCYIDDLIGQGYSLTYGLYDGDELIGMSLGYIKHWYTGTEYYIDELCLRKSFFLPFDKNQSLKRLEIEFCNILYEKTKNEELHNIITNSI